MDQCIGTRSVMTTRTTERTTSPGLIEGKDTTMPPATAKPAAKPAATKPAAKPAAAVAEEPAAEPRVKLSELPQEERDAKAQELITELYGTDDTSEEAQSNKRKVRARLRNIDKDWKTTYADFIETNWPAPVAEEPAEEAPAAPAKAPAKPTKPAARPVAAKK